MITLTEDLKKHIDNYFENITPDELYDLSIKYGFQEVSCIETSHPYTKINESLEDTLSGDLFEDVDTENFALAA